MVQHQLGDHLEPGFMCGLEELSKIIQGSIRGMHVIVVRYVITVIAEWRGIERKQPDRGDAEVPQVIELTEQPLKVSDAIIIGITKGLDMELVNYCAFKPIRASWFGDSLCFAGWNLHTKSRMSSRAVIDPRGRGNAMGIKTSSAMRLLRGVEVGQA